MHGSACEVNEECIQAVVVVRACEEPTKTSEFELGPKEATDEHTKGGAVEIMRELVDDVHLLR